MGRLKRVSMAGADVAVTDAEVADLVIEYAMHLGRVGMTDTVTVPVALGGRPHETRILIGPASQITVGDNVDALLESVDLPDVEAVRADLRRRIDALTGPRPIDPGPEPQGVEGFPEFDAFDDLS